MAEIIKMRNNYKQYELSEIAKTLIEECEGERVCTERKQNGKSIMLCYEKYYMRVKNYVALSILLNEEEDVQEVTIVGFAGGESMFNISYGANKSFAKSVINILERMGMYICED